METQSKKKLVYGMLITFGMHLIVFGILVAIYIIVNIFITIIPIFGIFITIIPIFGNILGFLGFHVCFIAVTQLIYLLPIIFILKRKEEFAMMKGVIVGAVITALLNGGCWLMIGLSLL